jgi:hypothetical protein
MGQMLKIKMLLPDRRSVSEDVLATIEGHRQETLSDFRKRLVAKLPALPPGFVFLYHFAPSIGYNLAASTVRPHSESTRKLFQVILDGVIRITVRDAGAVRWFDTTPSPNQRG